MARSNRWIADDKREAVYRRDIVQGVRVCWYCDRSLAALEETERPYLSLDHLTPRSRWGPRRRMSVHDPRNLITSCWWCNDSKRTQTLAEFLVDDPQRAERIFKHARDHGWRAHLADVKRENMVQAALPGAVASALREHIENNTVVEVDGVSYCLVPWEPDPWDDPF